MRILILLELIVVLNVLNLTRSSSGTVVNDKIRQLEDEIAELDVLIALQKRKLQLLWSQQAFGSGERDSNVAFQPPSFEGSPKEEPLGLTKLADKDAVSMTLRQIIKHRAVIHTHLIIFCNSINSDAILASVGNGELALYSTDGVLLASYVPSDNDTSPISHISSNANIKKGNTGNLIVTRTTGGAVKLFSIEKTAEVLQVRFEGSLSEEITPLNITAIEVFPAPSVSEQLIITGDEEGFVRFHKLDGAVAHRLRASQTRIVQFTRKLKKLAVVSEDRIVFVDMGTNEHSMAERICVGSANTTFVHGAHDSLKQSVLFFAANSDGAIAVFNPTKSQGAENYCKLVQVITLPMFGDVKPRAERLLQSAGYLHVLSDRGLTTLAVRKNADVVFHKTFESLFNSTEVLPSENLQKAINMRRELVTISAANQVAVLVSNNSDDSWSKLLSHPAIAVVILLFTVFLIYKQKNRSQARRKSKAKSY
eukprot:TRINITY_DN10309_c0_g1_i1.p1 TRINITY_DN10309_c0_g1~~TRINITY_DN10309_c0_g1_i1.p1  ORF type:complete len:480 (-),score=76.66 TRINITY_DN10309_c0_g1_i1:109-1548(-)